jgi:hypothetical protein
MKMTFFWVIAPSCLTEVYRSFTGAYRFHHQGNGKLHPEKRFVDHEQAGAGRITSLMEAVSTSETSVKFYETTRRNIPEDVHNLKKHISRIVSGKE